MGDAIYLTPLENEKKQPSELYFDKCLNKACQNIPYTPKVAGAQIQHRADSESESPRWW